MMKSRLSGRLQWVMGGGMLLLASASWGQGPSPMPLVPERVEGHELVRMTLDQTWWTAEERSELRVFHGVWDERDLTSPLVRAMVAINAGDDGNQVLDNNGVPAVWRAEARLQAGELEKALAILGEGGKGGVEEGAMAVRIAAEAMEGLGRHDDARQVVGELLRQLQQNRIDNAAAMTEAVRAMMVRARLQGQPARDFQTMLDLLGQARLEMDRLYWPAYLTEGKLLFEKHKMKEAVGALHETLALNPRCAEAWFLLGRIALRRFDFDSGQRAAETLRRFNPHHPLADLLQAESRLIQDDPEEALEVLDDLLIRRPRSRPAHGLRAAAFALLYDEAGLQEALAICDRLSPGQAAGYATVGRFLAIDRQYGAAAVMLNKAIDRQPAWPEPQIELGLLEMQSGRDALARDALAQAVELDPFNARAVFSLKLLEDIADYKDIETEHFIIRYESGVDAVLAEMMPATLERIHATVSERLQFEPDQKTVIEVHPNHQRFAVRITGMPGIHTVAACTGPVIALEVPREGAPSKHLGLFDWPRVLQHEYTHTITLAQTRNRIPHWFTEAIAVRMELSPRKYMNCLMLARSLQSGSLFSLEDIKWAFVRPKRKGDRGKAYAQGAWMVEFMDERFGSSSVIRLLEQYFEGVREEEAMPLALGITREAFFQEFLAWAKEQVKQWGLDAQPSMTELKDELRAKDPRLVRAMEASRKARLEVIMKHLAQQVGKPRRNAREAGLKASDWPPLVRPPVRISDDQLAKWREDYPDHPDLLKLDLERRLKENAGEMAEGWVEAFTRLLELRPVDPWPHRKLAQYYLGQENATSAAEHLEQLDVREEKSAVYALELARIYRQQGEGDRALAKAQRAVNMNPYHAPSREQAATIALEGRHLDLAKRHILALTLLEPDRPRHQKRLQAIERLMNR